MIQKNNNTTNKRQNLNRQENDNRNIGNNEKINIKKVDFKTMFKDIFSINNIVFYLIMELLFIKSINVLGNTYYPFVIAVLAAAISTSVPIAVLTIMALISTAIFSGIPISLLQFFYLIVLFCSIMLKQADENENKQEKFKIAGHVFWSVLIVNLACLMFPFGMTFKMAIIYPILATIFYKLFVNAILLIKNYNKFDLLDIYKIVFMTLTVAIAASTVNNIMIANISLYYIIMSSLMMYVALRNNLKTVGISSGIISVLTIIVIHNVQLALIMFIATIAFAYMSKFKKSGIISYIISLLLVVITVKFGLKINSIGTNALIIYILNALILLRFTSLIRTRVKDILPKTKMLTEGRAEIEEAIYDLIDIEKIKTVLKNKEKQKEKQKNNKDSEEKKENIENNESKIKSEELNKKEKKEDKNLFELKKEEIEKIQKKILGKLKENKLEVADIKIDFINKEKEIYKIIVYLNRCEDSKQCEECPINKIRRNLSRIMKEEFGINDTYIISEKKCGIIDEKEICQFTYSLKDKYKLDIETDICFSNIDTKINIEKMKLKDNKYIVALFEESVIEKSRKINSSKMFGQLISTVFNKGYNEDNLQLLKYAIEDANNKNLDSNIDALIFDLYNGELELIKKNANPTYLKRGEEVIIIKTTEASNNIDTYKKELEDGDIIVIVSDELINSNNQYANVEMWIKEVLDNIESNDVKDISNKLKEKVFEYKKFKKDNENDFGLAVVKIKKINKK